MPSCNYVLVKTSDSFEHFAQRVRRIVNVGPTNVGQHIVDQERDGANWGGKYYLFEVMGVELYLVLNRGDVELEDSAQWPYYIAVIDRCCQDGAGIVFGRHLQAVLKNNGLEAKLLVKRSREAEGAK